MGVPLPPNQIDVGTVPDDNTGDLERVANQKYNAHAHGFSGAGPVNYPDPGAGSPIDAYLVNIDIALGALLEITVPVTSADVGNPAPTKFGFDPATGDLFYRDVALNWAAVPVGGTPEIDTTVTVGDIGSAAGAGFVLGVDPATGLVFYVDGAGDWQALPYALASHTHAAEVDDTVTVADVGTSAPPGVKLGVNPINGDAFYVDGSGDWQILPTGTTINYGGGLSYVAQREITSTTAFVEFTEAEWGSDAEELILVMSARTDGGGVPSAGPHVRLGTGGTVDTGVSYGWEAVTNGNGPASDVANGDQFIFMASGNTVPRGPIPGGAAEANIFGTAVLTFSNLQSATNYTNVIWHGGVSMGGTAPPSWQTCQGQGHWKNTAVPDVLRVTATNAAFAITGFVAGSKFVLYKRSLGGDTLPTASIGVRDEDAAVGTRPNLNFHAGPNVTLDVVDDAGDDEVDVTISSAVGVRDNDVDVATRPNLNFVDTATVTWAVTDDGGNSEVEISATAIGGGGGGGGGGGALEFVSQQILGADAATVDFVNSTGDWDDAEDLILVAYARTDRAANSGGFKLTMGSGSLDTGANYRHFHRQLGTGSSNAGAGPANSIDSDVSGPFMGNTAAAGALGYAELTFPGIQAASQQQMYWQEARFPLDADGRIGYGGGSWANAAVIDRFRLVPLTGAVFRAGSRFTLYKRVPVASGGGGGGLTAVGGYVWTPDATPHALNDEFNARNGAAPAGWTVVPHGGSPAAQWVQGREKLSYFSGTIASGEDLAGLVKPLGGVSSPATFVTAVKPGSSGSLNHTGLVLSTTNTFGTGTQLLAYMMGDPGSWKYRTHSWTAWNTRNSQFADLGALRHSEWWYVAVVWVSANTWRVLASLDGTAWEQVASFSFTFTPSFVGLANTPWSGGGQSATFGMFRVYTSAWAAGINYVQGVS